MKISKLKNYLFLPIIILLVNFSTKYYILNPKGQIAFEQSKLIFVSFLIMLIIVVPVILMSIIFLYKYSEKNYNHKNYKPNWDNSKNIEIVTWTVPIIIVFFLSIITWNSTHKLDPYKPIISNTKTMDIEAISLDWKWIFLYPKQNIASVNELAIPINTPIHFIITSSSVMNSFFIPKLGSQMYAMAGMKTQLYLISNKPGIYTGFSSNYSGVGFSNMKFKVISCKNMNYFNKWLKKVRRSLNYLDAVNLMQESIPSIDHQIEYFNKCESGLFNRLIDKFKNNKNNIY
ncbi:Cytochrome bo(3) ubiquinol oxidase subunit 2 precursor [Candidatus Annandia adelgestsuga]|uniref:Ubiquinol oxidase subunit 2 n=1 Tax=Candidatus Annandia adelgestsuga TaxID=1302411 RepID=A0A3S9J7M4_9ENTR|nr:ubiquinol oxidase subunit II [Candidatus Annandia adelgestsuga]AZP36378.1 Cytochrome bo(3) ubiquinol oxidase subunit 2 precursor [Candidatus Annandia adelgestsuga]